MRLCGLLLLLLVAVVACSILVHQCINVRRQAPSSKAEPETVKQAPELEAMVFAPASSAAEASKPGLPVVSRPNTGRRRSWIRL